MQDRILKDLDQSQFQRSVNINSQSSQYQISAPSQQQSQARKIPKCRVDRFFNSNIFDKENVQLDQQQFQRQNEIQQGQKEFQNQKQQMIYNPQQNQHYQVHTHQQALKQQYTAQQQSYIPQNRETFNKDYCQQDPNDSLNYIQRPSEKKMNSYSNEKICYNSKIEQPYQIQSAEVKNYKFNNRANNQEWLQFGNQQKYDITIDQNEYKKIAKNLNFTDSFNIGQILQESAHNLQSMTKLPYSQLNSSFQSNSSLERSRAAITDKQINISIDQQQKQQYQQQNQQNLMQQELNKKRSQSLQTQAISTQNSLQQLNVPINLQMQYQSQNYCGQQQHQKQFDQSQDNFHVSHSNYQKPPTSIQQHNIYQITSQNQNNLNSSNSQLNSSIVINQFINNSNSKPFSLVSNTQPSNISCQNHNSLNQPPQNLLSQNNGNSQKCQDENYFSQKARDQINSMNNLDQSALYKSVVSQINEDFISKDSMNLLLHEEDFLKTYRMKIEQEKNSMRQSYDFIMNHIYEQISSEMNMQFSLLDKQVKDFIDLFQKFKNLAIEYKNISSQIPPLSTNLKNMWNSNILNNVANYIQEGGKNKQQNQFEIVDWEECIQSKTQNQQQQHAFQQIYFQQKELLLQTEYISQQIYSTLQNNRQNLVKDESLKVFFAIIDQMKPQQAQTKSSQLIQPQTTHHLLDNQKQSNYLKQSKNNSLERHAGVITTEFSPEKMDFKQTKDSMNNNKENQQVQELPSQIKQSLSNFMSQCEINTQTTKLDIDKWDINNIFTQIQSHKQLTNESNKMSYIQRENQNFKDICSQDEMQSNTLPLDKLVQLQREQLLNQSQLNQSQLQQYFVNNQTDFNIGRDDVNHRKSLQIIAQDFVERIDSYKAPYMFRDDDQIQITERNKTITDKTITDRSQQQNEQKNNKKRSLKKSSRSGKLSNISNNGGVQNTNQLQTDREQEMQFDDQQDQFNNTYSIQLSVSRISNQDVDQLNETINNLRLLNDSFSNQNLNETLMNLQLMNSNNNSINNGNNRISLKYLLAQTNQQLTKLNLNQQNPQQIKLNNNPPPPAKNNFFKNKQLLDESELENKHNDDIFSEQYLKQLREQLKRQDSNEELNSQDQESKKEDSIISNSQSFHRKLKSSRVNTQSNQSNQNIDVNEIVETDREHTQQSTSIIQNKIKKNPKNHNYLNLPLSIQPSTKKSQQSIELSQNQKNLQNIQYSSYQEQNTNRGSNIELNSRRVQEQELNMKINNDQELNTKRGSEHDLNTKRVSEQEPIIKITQYESNNKMATQNQFSQLNQSSQTIKQRSNSHLEIPNSSQQINKKLKQEYNSVENNRKGLFVNQENDSSRSNQTIKETQNSSRYNPSDVQSHMSILTSKRRFESSLTRLNCQPTSEPYNIEFEGYVKQKQCLNDSFSRSSQRLNSQQSCNEKQNIVSSPSCRNSITPQIDEKYNYQKILTELEPTCCEQYQYIKRDMKSIDIFKPKTYQLYLDESNETAEENGKTFKNQKNQLVKQLNDLKDLNQSEIDQQKENDLKLQKNSDQNKKQVISCLWVRENVFAFGISDNTLIIYDASKAVSDNSKDIGESLKRFSTKAIIHKMVRLSDSIIALSSRSSKNIKLFDVDRLEFSLNLIGHNESVTDMTFVQPNLLISCSTDGCMILWQDFIITHKKQNKNQIKLLQTTNDYSRLICVDTSNQILVYSLMFNDNKSRVSEIRIEKIIKTSSNISSINSSFSNNNLLACGTDEGIIRIYDIQTENVIKIIKVSLNSIKNLLIVEHPTSNHSNLNFILIAASESDDDLVTFSKISNSNDVISTNSKYRTTKTIASNNLSAFFILNSKYNQLQLFTLDQQASQFSLWSIKCQ